MAAAATTLLTPLLYYCHFQIGATPLHIACQVGYLPVVECLIAANAGVNQQRKVQLYSSVFICHTTGCFESLSEKVDP